MTAELTHTVTSHGWIFYDARCGLCAGGARRLGGIAKWLGFRLMPLQRRWVRDLLLQRGVREDELLRDARVLMPDGELLSGAEMYAAMSRRVWWGWPVVVIAAMPGGMGVLRWLYRRVADNRLAISAALGLRARAAKRKKMERVLRRCDGACTPARV